MSTRVTDQEPVPIEVRPFRWDDLPGLVDMLNQAAEVDDDEFRYTLDETRHTFATHPAARFVAVTDTGEIAGFCEVLLQDDYGQWPWGCVHPDYRRRGIGTRLVRTADDYAYSHAPSGQSAVIDRITSDSIIGEIRLLEAEGYRALRDHYAMRITLDRPFEPPQFPEGITLRPFLAVRDMRAVYEAHQEAFRDHWGFSSTPFDTWARSKLGDPRFDEALWLVAVDGNAIAGLCLCRRWDDRQPELGFVEELAVRRLWRKRGLGMALLQQSFHILQQHGFTAVRLGVDAENQTNAVALYERAGMYIDKRYIIYRKLNDTHHS